MSRSTITDEGLLCLAGLPLLARLVLSLNTQARVTEAALRRLLAACPGLRVLELGGAANTKSLYFQGGDAKRRNEVSRVDTAIEITHIHYILACCRCTAACCGWLLLTPATSVPCPGC